MSATVKGLVRIRLVGDPDVIEKAAIEIVHDLEKRGHLVIEWTRPYQCRPPEEDKSRLYIETKVNAGDKQ